MFLERAKEKNKLIIVAFLVFALIGCKKSERVTEPYINQMPSQLDKMPQTVQGNLLNEGYICEDDGFVYFRDFNNDNFLYRSKFEDNDKVLISEDIPRELQVMGDEVFFINADPESSLLGRIMKVNKNGGKAVTVGSDMASYMIVTSEWIYYLTEQGVVKIRLDGTERTLIKRQESESEFAWLSIYGDYLFFVDYIGGKRLYALKTDGTELFLVAEDRILPVVHEDELWENDCEGKTSILSLKSGNVREFPMEGIIRSVIYNGSIFFYTHDGIFEYNKESDSVIELFCCLSDREDRIELIWVACDRLFFLNCVEGNENRILYFIDLDTKEVHIVE